jgi:hypothetical protein
MSLLAGKSHVFAVEHRAGVSSSSSAPPLTGPRNALYNGFISFPNGRRVAGAFSFRLRRPASPCMRRAACGPSLAHAPSGRGWGSNLVR